MYVIIINHTFITNTTTTRDAQTSQGGIYTRTHMNIIIHYTFINNHNNKNNNKHNINKSGWGEHTHYKHSHIYKRKQNNIVP